MKCGNFFVLFLFTFLHYVKLKYILFQNKDEMKSKDYIDRSIFMRMIKEGQNNGKTRFNYSSNPKLGFYEFHLYFPLPSQDITIYSVTFSANMKTKNKDMELELISLNQSKFNWIPVDFSKGESTSEYDFSFKISIEDLEAIWIKRVFDNILEFSSEFDFFFYYTENAENLVNLTLEYPIKIKRIKSLTGNYDSTRNLSLISNGNSEEINLSFYSSLIPCVDKFPINTTICTQINPDETLPPYKLNEYAKFILFLTNFELASNYYLIKNKIELKTNEIKNNIDFTNLTKFGPISKGKMIFYFPMAIVGNQITVTATAEISPILPSNKEMNDNKNDNILFENENIWMGMIWQNIY